MTAIDLGTIQYLAERVIPDSEVPARVWLARPVVLALVAELRAAREVMRAAQEHKSELLWACTCGCVERALAAYDKVASSAPTTPRPGS